MKACCTLCLISKVELWSLVFISACHLSNHPQIIQNYLDPIYFIVRTSPLAFMPPGNEMSELFPIAFLAEICGWPTCPGHGMSTPWLEVPVDSMLRPSDYKAQDLLKSGPHTLWPAFHKYQTYFELPQGNYTHSRKKLCEGKRFLRQCWILMALIGIAHIQHHY